MTPDEIDAQLNRPFKRRRNLGRVSGGTVTRADTLARFLAEATTLRDLAYRAQQVGMPEFLAERILRKPWPTGIKSMRLHKGARFFYERKQEEAAERRRRMLARRVTGALYRVDRISF